MKSFKQWIGVLAMVGLAACGGTEVGSKYVKAESVSAAKGLVIDVSAADSSKLAGTRLEIPAGALKADATITLEVGMVDLVPAAEVAGPVAKWGPDGLKFSAPVKMTMPFAMPASKSTNALTVLVKEANGTSFRIPRAGLTIDATGKLVSFNVLGFTSFQPSTAPACATDTDCGAGELCQNAVCVAADGGAGGGGGGGGNGGGNGGGGGIDAGRVCATNLDCSAGETCRNGTCAASCVPSLELCDGIDNDCDGVIDNACSGTGGGSGGGGGVDAGLVCVTANDCGSGQLCINGRCQGGTGGGSGSDGGTGGGSPSDGGTGGGSGFDGGGTGGGSGNFCRSDLECSTSEICVNNACVSIPVSDGGSGGGAGGGGGTGGGAGGGTGGGAGGGSGADAGTVDAGPPSDGGSAPDAGLSCSSSSQCAMPEVCYQSSCQAIDCSTRPCPGSLTCVNSWCQ